MPWHFRLLSVCPRLYSDQGKLIAETAWRVRLATLGCLYRRVIVDPKQRVLIIRRRYFWLFRRNTRIAFAAVRAVTYGYQDWSPWQYLSYAHETFDVFSVGLELQSGRQVHLFHFFGEGTWTMNVQPPLPLPEWFWYWHQRLVDLTDLSGTQQRESQLFATTLSKMIGVPLRPYR
jgi:hypothetical protein